MCQSYEINLVNLVQKFNSEDKCRAYLEKLRWPDGVYCPRCGGAIISRIHDRNQFDCDACRYQFSVTAGTIMHDTKLPLWKWFLAVYMMVESKKSISANQLKRMLDVNYRTAWYLCHRIRKALETPAGLLRGIVEIDETWVGGKTKRGKTKESRNPRHNKTMIVGAVERGGEIRLKSQPGKKGTPGAAVLERFIRDNVSVKSIVYTDENHAYPAALEDHAGHDTVCHSQDEWVRGDVHTNTIEGAWGLFKRSLVGAYHQVSVKHLEAYLDEFEFRFNNRKNKHIFRDAMQLILEGENIEYRELVS